MPKFDRADHLLTDAVYAAYAFTKHNDAAVWTTLLKDTGEDARPFVAECYQWAIRAANCNYVFSVALVEVRRRMRRAAASVNDPQSVSLPTSYYLINRVEQRDARDRAILRRQGVLCSDRTCTRSAVACHVVQTLVMPAPAFSYLCKAHAADTAQHIKQTGDAA